VPTVDVTWAEFGAMIKRREFRYPHERKGQLVFNVFQEVCPEGATDIAGTEHDPFYHDNKIMDFMYRISNLFKEVPDYVQREAAGRGFV
jgi:hypothetical protein